MRGKSRAEFTNVLKSFETQLEQVRGKSFAEFTKDSKSFEETRLLVLDVVVVVVVVVVVDVHMHVCRLADGGANVFAFLLLADSNP